jgi:hemerythrin-like metal-binding protein
MSTEHQQLSEDIARIKSAISSQDLSAITRELMHLQSSEQIHFRHEEKLMEDCNYPEIVSHKATHNAMLGTLNNINRTVIIENLHDISDDLGKYLETSLRQIAENDNDFRDFLLELKKDAS